MKLNVFVSAVALLGAFQPRCECRAIENPGAGRSSNSLHSELQQLSLPILLQLGEYFIRLDNAEQNSPASSPSDSSPGAPATAVNQAMQLQLTQRLLQGKVGNVGRFLSSYGNLMEDPDSEERGKRSDDPPISLDLTFHLLREVLEMARAEQIAQQANDNRKMMDRFGK